MKLALPITDYRLPITDYRLLLVAAVATLMTANARAQEISTQTIHLRQVLEEVERSNPDIEAAKKFWEAAKQKTIQAATLQNPRLDLERMYAPQDQDVLSAAQEKNTLIVQELPFPSKLYLRARVASKEAEMTAQKYHAKRREARALARANYAMFYLAHTSLEIVNENIELMRRFAKVAESKYAAGHVSQTDVLKAQVELTKMLNMLVALNQEKQAAQFMLNALMGNTPHASLGAPVQPASAKTIADLSDLERQALENRPELREAALDVDRAGSVLSLARSEFIPDFMLGYRRRSAIALDTHDAMIGFTLPLWFWAPRSMTLEAKAQKEMAEAQFEAMRLMTLSGVRTFYTRAQAAQSLMELYQTGVFPQAEAALKVAESNYRSGKASFLDLMDAQRAFLSFRLEYYQYLAEYEATLADLERVVGVELK